MAVATVATIVTPRRKKEQTSNNNNELSVLPVSLFIWMTRAFRVVNCSCLLVFLFICVFLGFNRCICAHYLSCERVV